MSHMCCELSAAGHWLGLICCWILARSGACCQICVFSIRQLSWGLITVQWPFDSCGGNPAWQLRASSKCYTTMWQHILQWLSCADPDVTGGGMIIKHSLISSGSVSFHLYSLVALCRHLWHSLSLFSQRVTPRTSGLKGLDMAKEPELWFTPSDDLDHWDHLAFTHSSYTRTSAHIFYFKCFDIRC